MDIYFNGKYCGKTSMTQITIKEKKSSKIVSLPNQINFFHSQKVNDEVRGYLIHNGSDWDFVLPKTYSLVKKVRKKKVKKLALILESPHKEEYTESGKPIRPANGVTGIKIKGFIHEYAVKWNLNSANDYQVKILNAVRYQCSCYNDFLKPNGIDKIIDDIRDEVFIILFRKLSIDGKNSLVYRINKYKPDIIVNACTGGFDYYKPYNSSIYTKCNETDNWKIRLPSGLNKNVDNLIGQNDKETIKTAGEKGERKRKKNITKQQLSNLIKGKTIDYFLDTHPCCWQ